MNDIQDDSNVNMYWLGSKTIIGVGVLVYIRGWDRDVRDIGIVFGSSNMRTTAWTSPDYDFGHILCIRDMNIQIEDMEIQRSLPSKKT